ncbi:MAG: twin-arginine translocation signal domain-containing protein [Verrucomicrobiia bacterium]
MKNEIKFDFTRREFIRTTAAAAAGIATGINFLNAAENEKKPLNYNPDMEYRRLGKTGIMVSAVCLGGRWKRIDTVVSGGGGINNPDFQKKSVRCCEPLH